MNAVYEKVVKCYESVKAKVDFTPKVALILGSGLGDYADQIEVVATLDYKDIALTVLLPTALPVISAISPVSPKPPTTIIILFRDTAFFRVNKYCL